MSQLRSVLILGLLLCGCNGCSDSSEAPADATVDVVDSSATTDASVDASAEDAAVKVDASCSSVDGSVSDC